MLQGGGVQRAQQAARVLTGIGARSIGDVLSAGTASRVGWSKTSPLAWWSAIARRMKAAAIRRSRWPAACQPPTWCGCWRRSSMPWRTESRWKRSAARFPGIVRGGVIEESPNLPQLKGLRRRDRAARGAWRTRESMRGRRFQRRRCRGGRHRRDAREAGQADSRVDARRWASASADYPDRRRRVGGRPHGGVARSRRRTTAAAADEGIWKESWAIAPCACVFSIMEPEEVFAAGEERRGSALRRVRAVLASRAGCGYRDQHSPGEARGNFTSPESNARFVNLGFLNRCVQEMVKLSPLLSYVFEVVPHDGELAVIGAAVNAMRA